MKPIFSSITFAALVLSGLMLPARNAAAQQNTKHDYVLLVRLDPESVKPDQARNIKAQWDSVVAVWNKTHSYNGGKTFLQEGLVLSGAGRTIEKGAPRNKGLRVISVIHLSAASMDEATELAKACPTLDMGGTVEVREVSR